MTRSQYTLRSPLLLALLAAVLTACNGQPSEDARPLVMVSVQPQQYLVERLAENRVRVALMIPVGASPTTYAPELKDLRNLSEADLYVKVGHPHFPFEKAWLDQILLDRESLPVVNCAQVLDKEDDDPHIWVNPDSARMMAIAIKAGLEPLLPDDREALNQNLSALIDEMKALDEEIQSNLEMRQSDAFFVLHPAWGHFAEHYGLEQIAIKPDHKATDARTLARIIERAREEKTDWILVQPQFSTDPAQTVADATGAEVVIIDPLAYDWPETLRKLSQLIGSGNAP